MSAPREVVEAPVELTVKTAAPAKASARPLFANTFDRYRWLMRNPAQQTASDEAFIAAYRLGEEYADMQAISDSLQVQDSKAYVRLYRRDRTGKYNAVPLDMSAL